MSIQLNSSIVFDKIVKLNCHPLKKSVSLYKMASLLKLLEEELKPLYTRLLLVKELIHPDVAGVVLSLEYRVREKIAIHKYNNSSGNAKLLEVLESRFVSSNIAFKIGMSEGERDSANGWFAVSRNILENKKELSAEKRVQI